MSTSDQQLALQAEKFEEKKSNDTIERKDAVEIEPGVWKTESGMVEIEIETETIAMLDRIMKENGFKDHDETLNFLIDTFHVNFIMDNFQKS